MSPRGGKRAGAGRPPDHAAGRHLWPGYRATDDEEARRIAAGQSPTQRIRIALTLLAEREDADG